MKSYLDPAQESSDTHQCLAAVLAPRSGLSVRRSTPFPPVLRWRFALRDRSQERWSQPPALPVRSLTDRSTAAIGSLSLGSASEHFIFDAFEAHSKGRIARRCAFVWWLTKPLLLRSTLMSVKMV